MYTLVIFIAIALIAVVEGGVIRKEFPTPTEGFSIDIQIKTNSKVSVPLSSMNINVSKGKITVSQDDKIQENDIPTIEDRVSIESRSCPIGYFKRIGICFPGHDFNFEPESSEEEEDENEVE